MNKILLFLLIVSILWVYKAEETRIIHEKTIQNQRQIVLFDGVCNLCSGFIDFVMNHIDLKNINSNHLVWVFVLVFLKTKCEITFFFSA